MTPEDSSLLAALPESAHGINGVPDPSDAQAREMAVELVESSLRTLDPKAEVRVSPLGAGWSTDIDVHVSELPEPAALEELGWMPFNRLSKKDAQPTRWAIVEGPKLLASVDLHVTPPPDPVQSILRRCTRRGEVRMREVLELRTLARAGNSLPTDPIISVAARIERSLGGNQLETGSDGYEDSDARPPVSLGSQRLSSLKKGLKNRTREKTLIAVSGVDGSGKSTLVDSLVSNLERAGYEVTRVWARPGMEMRSVKAIARAIKRLRGKGKSSPSAVRSVARGETGDSLPTSRKGVVGWAWALLVTLSYITRVRSGRRRGGRIVIFDRHIVDALVTLDFVYGTVNLSLHRALIRAFVPKAELTLYLEVPAETAIARKESVVFGEHAVREQLKRYEGRSHDVDGLVRLDSTLPKDELLANALRVVVAGSERVGV